MKKPPESLKLEEPLKSKNDEVKDSPVVLYDGMRFSLFVLSSPSQILDTHSR